MTIHYDRAMIDLVREIRKRVPSDAKPGVKLANPELFDELLIIHTNSKDVILNTLIKELFERTGKEWSGRLEKAQQASPTYQAKVYRGQIQLEEKPKVTESSENSKESRKRIYRGRVVHS